MIQANELRIGNYVKALGEYRMVIGITSGKFPSSYVKFEGLIPLKIIHLKPLEITEEWLIDFGFNKCFETCFELNGFILNENFILMDIDITIKLDYVHQLQNLYFALTKNELKL
jgi:hypothetical protein